MPKLDQYVELPAKALTSEAGLFVLNTTELTSGQVNMIRLTTLWNLQQFVALLARALTTVAGSFVLNTIELISGQVNMIRMTTLWKLEQRC